MNSEQFDQVVEAIIAGKYSWACVLLLRFSGYNPLHYIPYRTYNRLLKENDIGKPSRRETNTINSVNECSALKPSGKSSRNHLSQITDLSYLEKVNEQHIKVGGGNLNQCLNGNLGKYSQFKVEFMQQKIKDFIFATGELIQK